MHNKSSLLAILGILALLLVFVVGLAAFASWKAQRVSEPNNSSLSTSTAVTATSTSGNDEIHWADASVLINNCEVSYAGSNLTNGVYAWVIRLKSGQTLNIIDASWPTLYRAVQAVSQKCGMAPAGPPPAP